ncbi:MAG: hypothetical protein DRJ67_05425 [Thermoprotei archaeon]|nr:MAG: hypothetical protein DRJ67_05425 [Thermoprotei archaeon]
MAGLEHGFRRAVSGAVSGIVMTEIVNALVYAGLLPPSLLLYFKILNMLTTIGLIMAMPYWGTAYLLGWLCGLVAMMQVSDFEALIYLVTSLVILAVRMFKHLS